MGVHFDHDCAELLTDHYVLHNPHNASYVRFCGCRGSRTVTMFYPPHYKINNPKTGHKEADRTSGTSRVWSGGIWSIVLHLLTATSRL